MARNKHNKQTNIPSKEQPDDYDESSSTSTEADDSDQDAHFETNAYSLLEADNPHTKAKKNKTKANQQPTQAKIQSSPTVKQTDEDTDSGDWQVQESSKVKKNRAIKQAREERQRAIAEQRKQHYEQIRKEREEARKERQLQRQRYQPGPATQRNTYDQSRTSFTHYVPSHPSKPTVPQTTQPETKETTSENTDFTWKPTAKPAQQQPHQEPLVSRQPPPPPKPETQTKRPTSTFYMGRSYQTEETRPAYRHSPPPHHSDRSPPPPAKHSPPPTSNRYSSYRTPTYQQRTQPQNTRPPLRFIDRYVPGEKKEMAPEPQEAAQHTSPPPAASAKQPEPTPIPAQPAPSTTAIVQPTTVPSTATPAAPPSGTALQGQAPPETGAAPEDPSTRYLRYLQEEYNKQNKNPTQEGFQNWLAAFLITLAAQKHAQQQQTQSQAPATQYPAPPAPQQAAAREQAHEISVPVAAAQPPVAYEAYPPAHTTHQPIMPQPPVQPPPQVHPQTPPYHTHTSPPAYPAQPMPAGYPQQPMPPAQLHGHTQTQMPQHTGGYPYQPQQGSYPSTLPSAPYNDAQGYYPHFVPDMYYNGMPMPMNYPMYTPDGIPLPMQPQMMNMHYQNSQGPAANVPFHGNMGMYQDTGSYYPQ